METDVLTFGETDRRSRHRATYVGAVGLFLVVGLVVGIAKAAGGDPDSGPEPAVEPSSSPMDVRSLPQGAPPELPVWYSGSLHVGEQAYAMARPERIEAAGSTAVIQTGGGNRSRLRLLTTSGLVTLPAAGRPASWVLSAGGDIVVWVDRVGEGRREMVAWDVAAGEVLARRQMNVEVICCDATGELTVFGADAAGNLFGVSDAGFVWSLTTGELTRVPRVDYVDQVIASGPVLQSETYSTGFPGDAMRWQDGQLEKVGPLTYALAAVTTDGLLAAYPSDRYGGSQAKGDGTAVSVEAVGVGSPVVFEFPSGVDASPIGWEQGGALLIEVQSSLVVEGTPDAWIVRCDVDAHRCELALDLRGHGFWSGPE